MAKLRDVIQLIKVGDYIKLLNNSNSPCWELNDTYGNMASKPCAIVTKVELKRNYIAFSHCGHDFVDTELDTIEVVFTDSKGNPLQEPMADAIGAPTTQHFITPHPMQVSSAQFALSRKAEPMRTFQKAGITDSQDNFTQPGKEIFMAYLLDKHAADFKKTVVDPLVEELEEGKN